MNFFDKINDDIKSAMKSRDQIRLETLRAIKKELLEARSAKNANGFVSEENKIKLFQKMVKQRRDAATIYNAQNRADLGDLESKEADIISEYLPEQLSSDELEKNIREIIVKEGAKSIKEIGKVMSKASATLAGKAEGKEISQIVKKMLS